jgi:nucleoside-diphosphate-sugar epimerase
MSNRTCAVTGSTGFLGRNIVNKMKSAGWSVVRLQRQKAKNSVTDDTIVPFKLGEEIDSASLVGVNLLVHCAYDFSCTDWEKAKEINVEGTKSLFDAARSAKVDQIVYISSMHAFEGCLTFYGKAKLEGEKAAFDHGGIVIRPGTIYIDEENTLYGGQGGGTLHMFEKLLKIAPILPILYSKEPTIYTSHLDDIIALIEETITMDKTLDKPICAVSQQPHTLKQFLTLIRNRQHEKKVFFIPIPWRLPWLMLVLLERMKLKLPMRSESILGFFDQNPEPDFSTHKNLKTKMRSFS